MNYSRRDAKHAGTDNDMHCMRSAAASELDRYPARSLTCSYAPPCMLRVFVGNSILHPSFVSLVFLRQIQVLYRKDLGPLCSGLVHPWLSSLPLLLGALRWSQGRARHLPQTVAIQVWFCFACLQCLSRRATVPVLCFGFHAIATSWV